MEDKEGILGILKMLGEAGEKGAKVADAGVDNLAERITKLPKILRDALSDTKEEDIEGGKIEFTKEPPEEELEAKVEVVGQPDKYTDQGKLKALWELLNEGEK